MREPSTGRFPFWHVAVGHTDPGPGWDGIVHCQVIALEPPRHMVWSWRSGSIETIVRFDLEDVAGGTRLRFEQSGFTGLQGNLVRLIFGAGFRTMYGRKLPAYLGGEHRTCHQGHVRSRAIQDGDR